MTVVFDLLGVQNRDHGERGIARVVANLALTLESEHPDLVDFYLVDPSLPIPAAINPIISSGKAIRSDEPNHAGLSPTAGGVFFCGSVFELEQPLTRVLPPWVRTPNWRRVALLHDLIPLIFQDHYLISPDRKLRYMARTQALYAFDHLLTVSQASADDACQLLDLDPQTMSVIGAGADTKFRPPRLAPIEVARNLRRSAMADLRPGYILFPTGFDYRKNIDRMIKAYAALGDELREAHQLVMLCGMNEAQYAYMAELLSTSGLLPGEVLLTGRVSDEDLVALNQGAQLVVFPSIYEGFGLPVLEARRCGAPVICGDNSSLRELQPDKRARFDATDIGSITRAMESALSAEGETERLRNLPVPQFSWSDAAAGAAKALNDLAAAVVPATLPRLALISPLPPQQSGIATYTARLVSHLRHYADITVFVEPQENEQMPKAPSGVDVAPLSQLAPMIEGGGAFDAHLFFMGNSRFHVAALKALDDHGGVVLFHDVRLTSLYNEAYRLGHLGPTSVGRLLAEMYPSRYEARVEQSDYLSVGEANRYGILMVKAAAQAASRALVHSQYAADLIHLDSSVEAEVCYPLPAPDLEPPQNKDPSVVVASFGVVDPAKLPELIIETMATVRDVHPELKLHFFGPIDPAYQRDLQLLVQRWNLIDVVQFFGHVDDSDFARAQRSTTVAVQLRAQSNGESSAAVAELLAAGIPTVVSDLGAMSDLPDGAVVKIGPSNLSGELARTLIDLIGDHNRREKLSTNARRWAQANSFDRAAETLAGLLFG